MDEKLLEYIRKERSKGFSDEQIKDTLIKAGHEVTHVEEHIKHSKNESGPSVKPDHRYAIVAVIIIVILMVSIGLYFMRNNFLQGKEGSLQEYENPAGQGGALQEDINSGGQGSSLQANHSNLVDLNKEGWDLYNQKNYAEAIDVFNKAIEQDPNNAAARIGLGWSQYDYGLLQDNGLELFEQSIINFQKSIELNDSYVTSLRGLGNDYREIGDYNKSFEYLIKAHEKDPNDTLAYEYLGRTYVAMEEHEKAIGDG